MTRRNRSPRKLKEAITALKIEASYSKDEILETYLNTVPFLYNAYGIEMAARTYFDKSADKLNLLESATLIGMLNPFDGEGIAAMAEAREDADWQAWTARTRELPLPEARRRVAAELPRPGIRPRPGRLGIPCRRP